MPKPPDDPFDEVLSQVSDALDALNLGSGDARETLLDGVRDALKAIDGIEVFGDAFSDTEDTYDGPRLRVVDTEEAELHSARQAAADVRVKVLKPGRPASAPTPLSEEGEIAIAVEAGEAAGWQTVFRGESAHTYRIRCTTGALEVACDGAIVEQVLPGQTVDVSARLIRVSGGQEGLCLGRYARL
jgi:hypothetical protein